MTIILTTPSCYSPVSLPKLFLGFGFGVQDFQARRICKGFGSRRLPGSSSGSSRLVVVAATEGSAKSRKSEESVPSWARPDSDEPPPWAQNEGKGESAQESFEAPFFVYLLASAVTAIAAIGSVFEYVNKRPVFGVLESDSVLYTPLLGFFVFTGLPTAAFLWFRSVQAANKEAEEQDKRDGYR